MDRNLADLESFYQSLVPLGAKLRPDTNPAKPGKMGYIQAIQDYHIELERQAGTLLPGREWTAKYLESPQLAQSTSKLADALEFALNSDEYAGDLKCFAWNTAVRTSEGYKAIRSLKAGDILYTLDNGVEKPTTVLKNQCFGVSEVIRVRLTYGEGVSRGFTCTPDHKMMLMSGEWVEAQNLKPGDYLKAYGTHLFSQEAKESFFGMMLGDGSLNGTFGMSFTLGHCDAQKEYMEYKYKLLGLPYAAPKQYVAQGKRGPLIEWSTYSEYLPELSHWFHDFYYGKDLTSSGRQYKRRQKRLTPEIASQLTWRSFCFWYLDDGCRILVNAKNPNLRICSYMPKADLELAVKRLAELEVYAELRPMTNRKNGFDITFNTVQSQRFMHYIAPYVPSCMSYKLDSHFKCGGDSLAYSLCSGEYPLEVYSVVPANPVYVYCPTTDSGSFLVTRSDVMTHNCDGVRMIATYFPGTGFELFGRNRSVSDLCFTYYKDQIKGLSAESTKDLFKKSFILDCELTSINPNFGGRIVTNTVLEAVDSCLALNQADSWKAQEAAGYPLRFNVFDILYYDDQSWMEQPLYKRWELLDKLIPAIQAKFTDQRAGWFLPMPRCGTTRQSKIDLYNQYAGVRGDGVVLKLLDAPYSPVAARGGKHAPFIKFKRSVSDSMGGKDIDVFVIGGQPGEAGKGNENLISSLDLAVNLQHLDGTTSVHHIASCSGLPQDLKVQMTAYVDGKPTLQPWMIGKCCTIDGLDISSRSRRFMHCRILRWRDTGPDAKRPEDCVFKESDLDFLVGN